MRYEPYGGAAFPRPIGNNGADNYEDREVNEAEQGMSLRDYFAARLLSGVRLTAECLDEDVQTNIAKAAYAIADAMLLERMR